MASQVKRILGFTIVELLVVIVVIGILAAITIVSYTGISNRATVSSIQSDLTNASTQLKIFNVDNSIYPTTVSTDCTAQPDTTTNKCLKSSNGISYSYYVDNTVSKQNFCITATKDNYSYSINNTGTVIPAAYCPVLYLDAGNTASYPGSGTTWTDLSGNGNNGVLMNGVGFSNSNGGVLSFDGIDDYVNIANTPTLNSSVFTISFWMKPSTLPATNSVNPISHGYTSMEWFELRSTGDMDFYTKNLSSGFPNIATGAGRIAANTWYYIVGTFDGTTMRYYINNTLVNSNITGGITIDANSIWVGTGKGTTTGGYFNGLINNVYIYNAALSVNDINAIFNSLRGRYGI